jgi:hypothetical protein
MDRLITALSGTSWAFLVLAYPFQESEMAKLRLGLISELREIQTQVARTNDPSPLAGYYSELLRKGLETVTTGHEIGMWRTAVYLLGDNSGKIRH